MCIRDSSLTEFVIDIFIDNIRTIVKHLRSLRLESIIVSNVIPHNVNLKDYQYWKTINLINYKLHDFCVNSSLQYANLDQAVLNINNQIPYNEGEFYSTKDKKRRFSIFQKSFDREGNLTEFAYKLMIQSWTIFLLKRLK